MFTSTVAKLQSKVSRTKENIKSNKNYVYLLKEIREVCGIEFLYTSLKKTTLFEQFGLAKTSTIASASMFTSTVAKLQSKVSRTKEKIK